MATILVVDDEEQICCMLKEVLELDGHTVLMACDGLEAEQVMDATVELAIVDIIMPHKTGIDFVHGLRQARPGMAVILISGGGTFRSDADDAPCEAWLAGERLVQKPFNGAEIRQAVGEMIRGAHG